jgi:cysteine synthase A
MKCARDLATKEGIFVGVSCGGTFAAALEVCKKVPKGSTVLCMLPDTGERYLSTPLFSHVEADMNEAELEVSRSTPGYHLAPAAG